MPKKSKKIKLNKKKLEKLFSSIPKENKVDKKVNEENNNSKTKSSSSKIKINQSEFKEYLEIEDSTPALERLALSQPGPIFVGGIPQRNSSGTTGNSSSEQFKYTAGNPANPNESKYLSSPEHITTNVERTDFNKIGRDFNQQHFVNQDTMFFHSAETQVDSPTQERRWEIEMQDFEKERRKSFSEQQEEKYKKYNPDLPKSR